jgi:hypothetical protein
MTEAQDEQARVPKRLVVCFDGTWNKADSVGTETNVALLARSIHATTDTGGVLQCVLYLRGVGTSGLDITQKIDGATGLGIDDNIRSGYMFLAQNYVAGDEIFLFGFSRGAFTARSLVGLLGSVGLLKRQSLDLLGYAWNFYRERDKAGKSFAETQPHAQLQDGVDVTFLGVWDTVGALGIPGPLFDTINHQNYGFYDTGLCPIVRTARHALAIDEHRSNFVPTLWTGDVPPNCDVEQVWFAGAHADVGGGYYDRALADIPLVWMAQEAEKAGLSLDWGPCCLPDPASTDPLAPRHDSSSGLFAFNRVIPTVRRVCEEDVSVPLFQTLYVPTGDDGKPLKTVNERIHRSVLGRFGKADAMGYLGDPPVPEVKADQRWNLYRPLNLTPLFADGSAPPPSILVPDID